MVLQKLSLVNTSDIDVCKVKDNTCIQVGGAPAEIQTDWVTLGKYPLPSKKYLEEDAKSVALTVPIEEDSDLYKFFRMLGDTVLTKTPMKGKMFHNFVGTRGEGEHHIKFKLYLNTTEVFLMKGGWRDTRALHDFYDYLTEGARVRIVFGFSKMWTMGNQYGFSVAVRRLQVEDDSIGKQGTSKTRFLEESSEES